VKNELAYAVGDMVRIENKILSVDLQKTQTHLDCMTGLVIGIDVSASLDKEGLGYVKRDYIISVLVNEGLGLWDFGTRYWKIWKMVKED